MQMQDLKALLADMSLEEKIGQLVQLPAGFADDNLDTGPAQAMHLTAEDLSTVPLVGMGSLEKFARPLWEDCQRKGLTLHYQVVPSSFDALYQIKNSIASGFNTYLSNPNALPIPNAVPMSRLTGYTWELVALCPKSRPNHAAARLFAAFLQEKYCSNITRVQSPT